MSGWRNSNFQVELDLTVQNILDGRAIAKDILKGITTLKVQGGIATGYICGLGQSAGGSIRFEKRGTEVWAFWQNATKMFRGTVRWANPEEVPFAPVMVLAYNDRNDQTTLVDFMLRLGIETIPYVIENIQHRSNSEVRSPEAIERRKARRARWEAERASGEREIVKRAPRVNTRVATSRFNGMA